jgi:hypothetical protein
MARVAHGEAVKQQVLRLHTAAGVCTKCGVDVGPRRKPSKWQVCNVCRSTAQKEWRRTHIQKVRAKERRSAQIRKGASPVKRLLTQIKSRCKRDGVPFDLVESDVVMPDRCPLLGIEFSKDDRWSLASLDRIVPSLGYVKGNVWVVSFRANAIKSNATCDELEKVSRSLRTELGRRFRAQSNLWFKAVA